MAILKEYSPLSQMLTPTKIYFNLTDTTTMFFGSTLNLMLTSWKGSTHEFLVAHVAVNNDNIYS